MAQVGRDFLAGPRRRCQAQESAPEREPRVRAYLETCEGSHRLCIRQKPDGSKFGFCWLSAGSASLRYDRTGPQLPDPARVECGGKRSATPLSLPATQNRIQGGVALRLPPQSKDEAEEDEQAQTGGRGRFV